VRIWKRASFSADLRNDREGLKQQLILRLDADVVAIEACMIVRALRNYAQELVKRVKQKSSLFAALLTESNRIRIESACYELKEETGMTHSNELQHRIDSVYWYHEFEFPNGLIARSKMPDVVLHRRVWSHIRQQLDQIDFRGKTVLDLGCWDGYWSFYAEQRGAKRVLATDDVSQNWARSSGLLLAKELFGSNIETNLDVSVYDLEKLGETFDIVLCLGIYYHLVDPFYAFAQVRHCCHSESLAIFEGDGFHSWRQEYLRYDLSDHAKPIFVPTRSVLRQMLQAAYFEIVSESSLRSASRRRLMALLDAVKCIASFVPAPSDRFVTVSRAVNSENRLHHYPPPFGLSAYDTRFG